ncbi:energy-coupling factor transporter transmembrane protein EcfT [Desertihabitans brevis]|uniref:Energy-coupling factor transporter transmembrane protein EcfT n=1 Tax=Desertihabitans brevis TaxID=2268447 RepID=A0A367YYP5_9ACTN|nr:CbiQ family ECF transporter T component [Desertihabitans brevis]RCK70964.1 energy-coupling factor transporter transmembrane protein EcfT [Desertihabitans brevis]
MSPRPLPTGLVGVHRPGSTLLHRAPAGAKLLGLLVLATTVTLVRGPAPSLALLGLALALALLGRVGLGALLRSLRGLLVVVVLLGAWQTWQTGWARATETVAELVGLLLLATVLTATTRVDDLVATLVRVLGPLRRLGVDVEQVGLAVGLVLRAVPTVLEIAEETRQAALARGLERNPRARLVPLVVRVVASARATGEALHARGIGD